MHPHLHSHSTLLGMLALKKNNYDAIVDTKLPTAMQKIKSAAFARLFLQALLKKLNH